MTRCLIITQNRIYAKAIERQLRTSLVPAPDIQSFDAQVPNKTDWSVTDEFNRISDWIESTVTDGSNMAALRDTIVVTDLAPLHFGLGSSLNPCRGDDFSPLLAMLILAFPEIQWVAPADACEQSDDQRWTEDELYRNAHTFGTPGSLKEAFNLKREGFVPLFDPTALRNRIRGVIVRNENKHKDVPIRTRQAAAIDEEKSYAYLHAYTAYRFGFRSHVVTSENMMSHLFSNAPKTNLGDNFLLFEDLYLQFAEAKETGLSILSDRDTHFPKLNRAAHRIVITAGHGRKADREKLQKNKAHLREFRHLQHNCILFKPLAGVFDLWKDSGLDQKLGKRGLADGFIWPPKHYDNVDNEGHSAPGRLLEIATRLVDRAEHLLPEVHTVADCVHGAVLASDALELLAERTPTSALEALMLKQQFEVLAECQFCGVQDNLDVKSRLEDIQTNIKSLSYWFDSKRKDFIKWNAEAATISKLILLYREFNSFDEEQEVLARNRTLHRKMWFNKNSLWKPFEIIAWYVEYLLGSIPRFIVAIFLWTFVFAILYCLTSGATVTGNDFSFRIFQSISSFLAVQPPPDEYVKGLNALVVESAIIAGFVHLGIFISHLYSIISRR